MFYMMGRGLPLQLASLLHTPATSCSHFLQASSPSCSRAFAPAVPLSETLFPTHFHLDNTSHPSGLWVNVNSSEMSSPFLMISLTLFSPSTLSFLSMERNEAFICLLIGLLSVSLITIALGGQGLCPFYLTFHIQQLSNSKLSTHIFYEWMTFCSFSNIIHSLAWCNLALFYFAVLLVCLTQDELR